MKKLFEIRKELAEAVSRFDSIKSDDPQRGEALKTIERLNGEIKEAAAIEQAQQRLADMKLENEQKKEGRKFSFLKFIREAAENRLSGLEAEVVQMGRDEFQRNGLAVKGYAIPSCVLRAASGQNYGTDADGGYLTQTATMHYLDALKDKLVVNKLGATFLGNLTGSVPWVTGSNLTTAWEGEADAATADKLSFSRVTMTPHRIAVIGAFTKDLLRQTSIDVENLVLNKIIQAHAQGIEEAALLGSGTNGQPTGILNATGIGSVVMGTNGGNISYAKLVAMETAINTENAMGTKMAYLTNSKVIGSMKTTERDSKSGRYILDERANMVNGYQVDWTNIIPSNLTKGTSTACSAMIFGDWSNLIIGQWGGIDLVVDPYTLASNAEVRIILNAWNDVLVSRPESFVVIKDITVS